MARLYFDLDLRAFIVSALDRNIVTNFSQKRADTADNELRFTQGGVVQELEDGTTFTFGLKKPGDYQGGYLVQATVFVKTGTGASTVYTFSPNFNTVALNDFLAGFEAAGDGSNVAADEAARYAKTGLIVGTVVRQTDTFQYWTVIDADELDNADGWELATLQEYVVCDGELEWVSLDGKRASSVTVPFTIYSDVIRGTEELPSPASPGYYNKEEADAKFLNLVGKIIYVDSVNGNDGTAARGTIRPYLTLEAARDASEAGDLIVVWPGDYTTATSLAKDGVSWDFKTGATVTMSQDDTLEGIWDDLGNPVVCTVSGLGNFTRHTEILTDNPGPVLIGTSNSGTVLSISCLDLFYSSPDESIALVKVVHGNGGTLNLNFRHLTDNENSLIENRGIVWSDGNMSVNGLSLSSRYWGVFSDCTSADKKAFFNIDHIYGLYAGVYTTGTVGATNAAWWIASSLIECGHAPSDVAGGVVNLGGARTYITRNPKIIGGIGTYGSNPGLLYVTAQKVSAYSANAAGLLNLNSSGMVCRIEVTHWDANGLAAGMTKSGSASDTIIGGDFVGGAGGLGLSQSAGTLRLKGLAIDTSANSSTSPITKSGGTLILDDVALVAHASADSVSAPTAQNVKVYSARANKAVDGDVTQQVGTILVDSNVE